MGAQFLISKPLGSGVGRFYLIGDLSSVSVAQAALTVNCNATSADEPFTALIYPTPDGTNITHYPETTEIIQFYRTSSFALALSGFNASVLPEGTVSANAALPNSVDRVFLQCINSTIASTIPISDARKERHLRSAVKLTTILSGVICLLLVALVFTYTTRACGRLFRWIKPKAAGQTVKASSLWWRRPSRIRFIIILLTVGLFIAIPLVAGFRILVSFVYKRVLSSVDAVYRPAITQ